MKFTLSHLNSRCEHTLDHLQLGTKTHFIESQGDLRGSYGGHSFLTLLGQDVLVSNYLIVPLYHCGQHLKKTDNGRISQSLVTQFHSGRNPISCMSHITNLVAKAGIQMLDLKIGNNVQVSLLPSLALIEDKKTTRNFTFILAQVCAFLSKSKKSNQLTESMCQMIDNNPPIIHKV